MCVKEINSSQFLGLVENRINRYSELNLLKERNNLEYNGLCDYYKRLITYQKIKLFKSKDLTSTYISELFIKSLSKLKCIESLKNKKITVDLDSLIK